MDICGGKLSVVIPVYNGDKYLRELLESVQQASYKNYEIIIVDDGSTDNSSFIYEEFTKEDSRFRVVKQNNHGIVGARNCGLEKASGEYICFCDQDDIVMPLFWELSIHKMQVDDSHMCVCSTATFSDNKNIINNHEIHVDAVYNRECIIDNLLIPGLLDLSKFNTGKKAKARMTIWNCIFKRELLLKNDICFQKNISFEDDLLFRLDASLCTEKISTISYCGYLWRVHMASESHRLQYIENIWEKQEVTREYVRQKLEKACATQSALIYVNNRKCIDMIKIIENEAAISLKYRSRRQKLKTILDVVNTKEVQSCFDNINHGEIRYKTLFLFFRRGWYMGAFYANKILKVFIHVLYTLKLADRAVKFVKGQG